MIEAGRHTLVPEDLLTHVPVSIGSFCSIAAGCRVASGQHPGIDDPNVVSDFPFAEHGWGEYPPSDMGEGVVIDNDVWIGQDVLLLDRVRIGSGARIGAGAVVTKHVAPYSIMVGNPARVSGLRFTAEQRSALVRIAWWEWTDDQIRERIPDLTFVHRFIEKYDHKRMVKG